MSKLIRHRSDDHITVNNRISRDRNLSLKAKGLFLSIMSLPDSWDFTVKGIISVVKESHTAIYSALDELIEHGYCTREATRDAAGKFAQYDYAFYESPCSGFPYVEEPYVENQTQYKNKDINNISNKEKEDICRVVFDAWSQVMKHPKAKYDAKRKTRIKARLAEGFTVDDLKQVPYGALKSPWHMGQNPNNVKYDDIDTLYRDAAQVEKFLALARNGHGNYSEGCDICRNHPNRSYISLKTYGWIFNTETKQLEDCICKNGTA